MVLLTVDTLLFFNFVSFISSATYLNYILSSYPYGGGSLCTYCSATLALYFSSNCLKLEQRHWQYSFFGSELQSWLSRYLPGGVLVRNHSCKIDFSSLHTHHDIAPQFCTVYSCILFQIKWKKKVYL